MKVSRQMFDREFFGSRLNDPLDLISSPDTDRISDIDFIAPKIAEPDNDLDYRLRRDRAFIRTAETARNTSAQPQACFLGRLCDGREPSDRLVDGAIDVLLRKRFAGRAKYHDFVDLGCERILEPFHIGNERRIDNAGFTKNLLHHLHSIGHLWHPFRRNKRY